MMRFRFAERPPRLSPKARFAVTNVLALIALGAVSALGSHPVAAQATQGVLGNCPAGGALNALPGIFCNATLGWLGNAMSAAQHFFFMLVAIELAWSALLWTLQKENLGELITALILKLMGIFFFYTLLLFGADWLPKVMQTFIALAAQVTTPSQPISLDPMTVFNLGEGICRLVFANLPHPGFDSNIGHLLPLPVVAIVNDLLSWYFFEIVFVIACIICFVVFVSFLIAAGQLIMTLIEAYIMIGAGAVMLGFTGSRWTTSFGEKWIGYAFSIGVKLFVIYVIVALGTTIFPADCGTPDAAGICNQLQAVAGTPVSIDITNINGSTFNISTIFIAYLEIGGAAIIFMMLCQRLPSLAASMMNGSPSLTMSAAMATAMQVAGAVTGVVKAGAGAALGASGALAGAGGEGAGGGLMDAASVGGGIAGSAGEMGGGSMAIAGASLEGGSGGGGFGGDSPAGSVSASRSSAAASPGATGPAANGAAAGSKPAQGKAAAVLTAVGKGLTEAASSAASPLLNFNEGEGGGSVHIGLRLPE